MGEVGGVVAILQTMVSVVVWSSSQTGKESVRSPRQIVATVALDCQPAVEEMKEDLTEGVAAYQPGAAQSQQQQRQQLS